MIARSARGVQKHRPAAHPHPVRTVCFSQNRTWTHNLISKLKPLTGLSPLPLVGPLSAI